MSKIMFEMLKAYICRSNSKMELESVRDMLLNSEISEDEKTQLSELARKKMESAK